MTHRRKESQMRRKRQILAVLLVVAAATGRTRRGRERHRGGTHGLHRPLGLRGEGRRR